jgi:hypothetical protein
MSTKFKFGKNGTQKSGTLYEHPGTFMITAYLFLAGRRKVKIKFVDKIKAHVSQMHFSRKYSSTR